MQLSFTSVLVYILQRGIAGRLSTGRIERDEDGGLAVYTGPGLALNEYISGPRLRSWCVLGPHNIALPTFWGRNHEPKLPMSPKRLRTKAG